MPAAKKQPAKKLSAAAPAKKEEEVKDAPVVVARKEEKSVEPVTLETEVKNWHVVKDLSDGDMVVEAANVMVYQFSFCLLRFRIDGELTGDVIKVDKVNYNEYDGTLKARA